MAVVDPKVSPHDGVPRISGGEQSVKAGLLQLRGKAVMRSVQHALGQSLNQGGRG